MDKLREKFARKDGYINISDVSEDDIEVELFGLYPKFWFTSDNEKYLIKFDDDIDSLYGELIYYEIAKQILGDDFVVEYDLGEYQGRKGVICKTFLDKDEQFINGNSLLNLVVKDDSYSHPILTKAEYTIPELKNYFKEIFEDNPERFKSDFENFFKMFLIDSLLKNDDRNATNWGGIIDKETGKVKRLAPAFDNGHILNIFNQNKGESISKYLVHFYKLYEYMEYQTVIDEIIGVYHHEEDKKYRSLIEEVIKKIDFEAAIKNIEAKTGKPVKIKGFRKKKKDYNERFEKLKKHTIDYSKEDIDGVLTDYNSLEKQATHAFIKLCVEHPKQFTSDDFFASKIVEKEITRKAESIILVGSATDSVSKTHLKKAIDFNKSVAQFLHYFEEVEKDMFRLQDDPNDVKRVSFGSFANAEPTHKNKVR